MLKNLKVSLATACILFSATSAFAGTKIPLNGGEIAPGQSLEVDLSQLKSEISYTVQCAITSSDDTKSHFTLQGNFNQFDQIVAVLNGNLLAGNLASGINGAVNKGENTFNIPSVVYHEYGLSTPLKLVFENLDDSAIENVHDCYADIAVQAK